MHSFVRSFRTAFLRAFPVIILLLALVHDVPPASDLGAQVEARANPWQFDFVTWTLQALGIKLSQSAAGGQDFLSEAGRKQAVLEYFDLLGQRQKLDSQIKRIFGDPGVSDPAAVTAQLKSQQAALQARLLAIQPTAEEVMQEQISAVYAAEGFTMSGELIPPIAFHISALPNLLIVSPRSEVKMAAYANVEPGMTVDDMAVLEARVEKDLNVSALVEPIGGLGTYPTMVYETDNLNYTFEVCAHEWAHNYLTLRPLGINYDSSNETRIMNETAATLVGQEIGRQVVARYYPERMPPPPAPRPANVPGIKPTPAPALDPNVFDFNTEMHITRVHVDQLLAAGRIDDAEQYMEQRRQVFVQHGYVGLRRLNQAYFAFHGAYNASPGAGGGDPVGPAVVALREKSPSLKAFLDTMSWMTSFADLQAALK